MNETQSLLPTLTFQQMVLAPLQQQHPAVAASQGLQRWWQCTAVVPWLLLQLLLLLLPSSPLPVHCWASRACQGPHCTALMRHQKQMLTCTSQLLVLPLPLACWAKVTCSH
jgi:hypothetical protein